MADATEEGGWFRAVFNPLAWDEVEKTTQNLPTNPPDLDNLRRFLTDRSMPGTLEVFLEAYDIISETEGWTPIYFAPDQPQILTKLVWPLKHAKASFMLGNHVGTIALCGMIAEMVAMLRYEMEEFQPDASSRVYVQTFEAWGQSRRVRYLKKCGYTDGMYNQWFEMILEHRRKYLHFFSENKDLYPAGDALTCYRLAHGLVSWVIGNRHEQQVPLINPALSEWLARKGLVHPGRPDAEPPTIEDEPPKK
jgi:hypothetical protein